jgi:hypothetical protein
VDFDEVPGGESGPVLLEGIRTRFALGFGDGILDLAGAFSAPEVELGAIQPRGGEEMIFGEFETVAAGGGVFKGLGDVAGVVVFAVAAKPEEAGDDHLWAGAGAGALDGVAEDAEASGEVGAVDGVAGDAVTWGAVDEIAAGELVLIGGGIGVAVIGDDEDEGEFVDGGLVDGFVERAGGCGAVAEATGADGAMETFEASGEEDAIDNGGHGAEVTDHGEEPFARFAAVDVAVASAHGAMDGAESGADDVEDGFAEGEAAGQIADEGGEDVAWNQSKAERGAEGFLAAAKKDAALDFAGAVEAGQFIVQRPGEQHPSECFEILIAQGAGMP